MLCFNPKFRLRVAESNIFCYKTDSVTGDIISEPLLHPIDAIILSLFNGKRKTNEIASLLSNITNVPGEQSEKFVSNYIQKAKDLLVEGEINDKYQPTDFIMPNSSVDMSHFRLKSPLSLVLLLTYKCSSNCLYCYANRLSAEDLAEMDLPFAKRIVDQGSDCNVEVLYLGGGDPFSREWIFDLIEYINNDNIVLVLSTKEYLSSDSCLRLADAGVTHLQISVDSLKQQTADKLVGRKGFLRETLQTIDNLQFTGIKVTTNTVVTKYNFRDVPELVKHLISLGIENIILSRYYRSAYKHSDSLFMDNLDVLWLEERISEINREKELNIIAPRSDDNNISYSEQLSQFLSRARCSFGRVGLVVSPSGKVLPCEQLPTKEPFVLGDLSKTTLYDVWRSDKLKSLLYPEKSHFLGTVCYDCEHYISCVHELGWCIRDVFKVYGSTRGVHPLCPKSNHNVRLS